MSVKKYEAFFETVKQGSLTKAGEAVGLTQSAVSHIIAGMEQELGFPLIIRSRSGARLTPEGELIFPYIREIVEADKLLQETATSIRSLDAGTIRIGTFTSVAVHWLPSMMKRFQNEYPGVEFELLNGDYHDVNRWLAEGSVDVAFITLPEPPGCEHIPLMDDRLMAILPPDHRLAGLDRFPLKEMEKEEFISLLESSDHDARRALEKVGVKPNVKFTTKDDYAIIAMVEQGLGVSIVPELLLEGRTEGIRVMETSPSAGRTIALAFPPAARPGPASRRFAQCVSEWVNRRYGK